MLVEKRIDELIEAGWKVVDSDFDEHAFLLWKKRAFDCMKQMLGPEHIYTRHFQEYVRQAERMNLSSGNVIISATESDPVDEDNIRSLNTPTGRA